MSDEGDSNTWVWSDGDRILLALGYGKQLFGWQFDTKEDADVVSHAVKQAVREAYAQGRLDALAEDEPGREEQAADAQAKAGKVSLEIAARIWCDQEMRSIVMDVEAAEQIALIIDRVRREQAAPAEESAKPAPEQAASEPVEAAPAGPRVFSDGHNLHINYSDGYRGFIFNCSYTEDAKCLADRVNRAIRDALRCHDQREKARGNADSPSQQPAQHAAASSEPASASCQEKEKPLTNRNVLHDDLKSCQKRLAEFWQQHLNEPASLFRSGWRYDWILLGQRIAGLRVLLDL